MFRRVMNYIKENKVKEAGVYFASECNKRDIDLGILKIMFFNQIDKYKLIKLICGYSFIPDDLKIYYDKPEKAIIDYN